jgi:hypothetical protein
LVSVALFWLCVPLLLVYRGLRSDIPWIFIIVSATALGWILSNASVFFQHAAMDQDRIEERACFSDPPDTSNSTELVDKNGVTETIVENPCALGDWISDSYKPRLGLLYGPVYLLCCALPYWLLIVRRPSTGLKRQIVLLAVGVFVIEWTVILGQHTADFLGSVNLDTLWSLRDYLDPHLWVPLTIAVAFLVAWGVNAQVLQRFKHSRVERIARLGDCPEHCAKLLITEPSTTSSRKKLK